MFKVTDFFRGDAFVCLQSVLLMHLSVCLKINKFKVLLTPLIVNVSAGATQARFHDRA